MNKFIRQITEFINRLSKTQKMIASVGLLIVMIFLVNIISNVSFKKTFIDYKNTKAQDLVENSAVCTDRNTYLILEEITNNFLNSKIGKYSLNDEKVNLKDYYTYTLFEEYKYNMSYSKFKKIANNFYSKIFSDNEQKYTDIPMESTIDTIYLYSESRNMYLVELNTNSSEKPYIGIELDNSTGRYSIFFIE